MTELRERQHQRDVAAGYAVSPRATLEYDTPYDMDGSDLYIASEVDRHYASHQATQELKTLLTEKTPAQIENDYNLTDGDLLTYIQSVQRNAAIAVYEFRQQYEALSQEDVLFAHAIQDWVNDELAVLEVSEGPAEQGDAEYQRTAAVLDRLLIEFDQDDEDPRLIELAKTWRNEVLSEIDTEVLKRLYALVA